MVENTADTTTNLSPYTDADVRRSIHRALWLTGAIVLVASPVIWAAMGWRSWALFLMGAAISSSGSYEWLQLLSVVIANMEQGARPRPMARTLVMFFLRLGLAAVLLYVGLEFIDGSIYALLGGLALGLFSLLVESVRLLLRWRP
jgi:hypothetical protein